MKDLKVGDLVRDKLNEGHQSYGLGIITAVGRHMPEEDYPTDAGTGIVAGNSYNVYFTRFGKTIEFHGDYLEKVR